MQCAHLCSECLLSRCPHRCCCCCSVCNFEKLAMMPVVLWLHPPGVSIRCFCNSIMNIFRYWIRWRSVSYFEDWMKFPCLWLQLSVAVTFCRYPWPNACHWSKHHEQPGPQALAGSDRHSVHNVGPKGSRIFTLNIKTTANIGFNESDVEEVKRAQIYLSAWFYLDLYKILGQSHTSTTWTNVLFCMRFSSWIKWMLS